jgi:enoyl-[acyl-carrier protein] reductase III
VLGGSRGIGRGIALRMAADGLDCAITYRQRADAARDAVAAIEREGRRGLAFALDLREPERVAGVMEDVGKAFRRIDVLVANAAATAFRPIEAQKPHNVRQTLALSVESFVAAVQAALPFMSAGAGRVVVISGIDSHQAMTGHGLLGAAKAALESLVRALACELGPRGITVNAISPGFVGTDSSRLYMESLGLGAGEAETRLAAMTPVRRVGRVDDVAALAAYLASDAAGFLTGQTIVIDGGLTIVSPLSRLAGD